ncbi:phospholipase D/Transphosphatidylase [Parasphaerochaeta coccoides DSM 17374]|uniref:Cardiolipin synthase n=2 Tax=Parasphaerochaeta TaxID=3062336 RepID=F4GH55_PARC1|nr:phospholipase D/Transphosphatidylase [Parasphaerochaeta coccoides DSM 17374]
MKKLLKLLTGRLFISIILIAIQLILMVFAIDYLATFKVVVPLFYTLSFLIVVFILFRDENPAYKIAWMLPILVFPIYGGIFYLMFGNKKLRAMKSPNLRRLSERYQNARVNGPRQDTVVRQALQTMSPLFVRQSDYIFATSEFPVWKDTQMEYFSSGETFFDSLLAELKAARRFIFLEFFIVASGKVWDMIFSILVQKVREGVDVRFMYDDVGSITTIPSGFDKMLAATGIKVVAFNPLKTHLNARFNFRNHRKICVIDGNIAYTGGLNLADEYVNRSIRFGHWKDTGVMIKGDAVWNMTLMFLQLWLFSTGKDLELDAYRPTKKYPTDGFVQPFGDAPGDNHNVGENVYMQIINTARHYVWMTTPYLILDNEMLTALRIAAQSGIDVRIITPHYADKPYVHPVTRSYYRNLLEAGVRIYEYVPGFIHSKMFVCDDEMAVVGTTNMDYRSFFLHFECGIMFFGSSVVMKVRDDIRDTFEVCDEMTVDKVDALSLPKKFIQVFFKAFAPLM